MKRLKVAGATLAGAGVIAVSATGLASAASNNSSNGNVGSSGIPRSVFMQEKQDAVAAVLNTTAANVQQAHKDHTFKQLIQNAGLTNKTFAEKVKAQLTADLEAKGYSQDQITIAMQHKEIVRLHHKEKKAGN